MQYRNLNSKHFKTKQCDTILAEFLRQASVVEVNCSTTKMYCFSPQRIVTYFEVLREREESICLKLLLIFNFSDHLIPVIIVVFMGFWNFFKYD